MRGDKKAYIVICLDDEGKFQIMQRFFKNVNDCIKYKQSIDPSRYANMSVLHKFPDTLELEGIKNDAVDVTLLKISKE